MQAVADAAGCDELEPGVAYQFAGRSQEFVCSDGGTDVGLIHSFDAELQQSVVRYLDARTDVEQLNPCPDGSRHPGPWIIVDSTWAASSYDESRMRSVAADVGGAFVGGGATPDDPPLGPPASYLVPGYCDR